MDNPSTALSAFLVPYNVEPNDIPIPLLGMLNGIICFDDSVSIARYSEDWSALPGHDGDDRDDSEAGRC